jgi:beta-lactamase superfamily II metal-dependent hydrolase
VTSEREHDVTIAFVGVGQGDCTVAVDHGTGRALLIDCPNGRAAAVKAVLSELGDPDVDTAIITHWDIDHFAGVLDMAEDLTCNVVLYNHESFIAAPAAAAPSIGAGGQRVHPDPILLSGLRRLNARPAHAVGPATRGSGGRIGRIQWTVLAPRHADLTRAVISRNRNTASVVIRLDVEETHMVLGSQPGPLSVLVCGDADGELWPPLLSTQELRSQIVRWPHHGAVSALGGGDFEAKLLTATGAQVVVLSVGSMNRYHHPRQAVVRAITTDCRVSVMCSQFTPYCGHPAGASPCAGTVLVQVVGSTVEIHPTLAEHRARVEGLPHAQCLPTGRARVVTCALCRPDVSSEWDHGLAAK